LDISGCKNSCVLVSRGNLSIGMVSSNPLFQTVHDVSKIQDSQSFEIPLKNLQSKQALNSISILGFKVKSCPFPFGALWIGGLAKKFHRIQLPKDFFPIPPFSSQDRKGNVPKESIPIAQFCRNFIGKFTRAQTSWKVSWREGRTFARSQPVCADLCSLVGD
jgi:hypothetical protein